MQIENAVQATEIVKIFLEKMNSNLAFSPRKATLTRVGDGVHRVDYWIVEVTWGFQPMVFKVRQSDGVITEYETVTGEKLPMRYGSA
ncbi:MAG: hypothetical protein HY671_00260 [Chloroflexi bacterium]|nr:hypothetical protein [Chloroflexota bacterium]